MNRFALDSNVVIYNHAGNDPRKRSISRKFLRSNPVISSQVLSEYLNYMKNKYKAEKRKLIRTCARWLRRCIFQPVSRSTVELASRLIDKYDFQLFDGIIVASALEANCGVLYSEDMQHGQVIEASLKIVNPYI